MSRVLFYLPLLLLQWSKLLLPRKVFVSIYSPSTNTHRELEQTVRNTLRRNAYLIKKGMYHE